MFCFIIGIGACSGGSLPPVADHSPVFDGKKSEIKSYQVSVGDTLYSIAWRFKKDFKELARYNNIYKPYVIRPGQTLLLSSRGNLQANSKSYPKSRSNRTNSASHRKPADSSARPSVTVSAPAKTANRVFDGQWRWPAAGRTTKSYGKYNAGVDIRVPFGTSVYSAARGEVVYAGQGLRGFQYLIIVKHSEEYLSAYALNQRIFVKEGQKIKGGAKLADIKRVGAAEEILHFEIRKDGDPVNPGVFIKAQG